MSLLGSIFGGDAPSPGATAGAQGRANIKTAEATTQLNRPNQYTPWGNLTWDIKRRPGTAPDLYTSHVTLPKVLRQTLKAQQLANRTLAQQYRGISGQLKDEIQSGPVEADKGYRRRVENAIYNQMTRKLDPRFAHQRNDLETQLANQGIQLGSEAWDRAMEGYRMDKNDAYQTAMNSAIAAGNAAMDSQFRRDSLSRSQPIDMLNALRPATSVGYPQLSQQMSGASVAGTPIADSIWNSYNAEQAGQTNMMNGLLGLGNLLIPQSSSSSSSSNSNSGGLLGGLLGGIGSLFGL